MDGFNKLDKLRKSGFTLIELLVVVAIIGLLASVVLATLNNARAKSRDARRIADLNEIRKALELFYNDYESYPTLDISGSWLDIYNRLRGCLQSTNNADCNMAIPNGVSYMSSVPQDPLGDTRSYYYYRCSSGQRYRLRAVLEINNTVALNSDIDGAFYGAGDTRCDDNIYQYCLGTGEWCW